MAITRLVAEVETGLVVTRRDLRLRAWTEIAGGRGSRRPALTGEPVRSRLAPRRTRIQAAAYTYEWAMAAAFARAQSAYRWLSARPSSGGAIQ